MYMDLEIKILKLFWYIIFKNINLNNKISVILDFNFGTKYSQFSMLASVIMIISWAVFKLSVNCILIDPPPLWIILWYWYSTGIAPGPCPPSRLDLQKLIKVTHTLLLLSYGSAWASRQMNGTGVMFAAEELGNTRCLWVLKDSVIDC